MSKFAAAMVKNAKTWNNAVSLSTPDPSGKMSGRVSLFFKSVRGLTIPQLYQYMKDSSNEDVIDTFLLSFNIRDCRGGKGERDLGRRSLIWLFLNYPKQFYNIMCLIPEYGRWDDLLQFFPNVLDLSDIKYLRQNYCADISDQNLNSLKYLQSNIVKIFSSQLKNDLKAMNEGKPCSLAAKWAPTEKDSLDSEHGVYKTLATSMGISPRVLRKKYLTPLRGYIKIVEKYMCDRKWNEIDYNKVPSCAMKKLKKAFEKHDVERFQEWKTALSKNDPSVAKVCGKQLYPHELVREIRNSGRSDAVCEAQWKVLEEETLKLGSLEDSVVVVDTSASMHCNDYLPFDVACSLGILISGATRGCFKNHVITFNNNPEFVLIKEGTLINRWIQVSGINWGGSTNIQKTFEMILERSKQFELKQEDMPKRLFIISDMQFNCVEGYNDSNKTNYEKIEEMYKQSGYTRPQIVFWNVNGLSNDFPVTVGDHGTAMISGFSPSLLSSIIKGQDFSPYGIVRETLDGERLSKVKELLTNPNIKLMINEDDKNDDKENEDKENEDKFKEFDVLLNDDADKMLKKSLKDANIANNKQLADALMKTIDKNEESCTLS